MASDPVLPCDVEKFELKNGTVVMLERPRMVQSDGGRRARGYIVGDDGRTTEVAKTILMADVSRHVTMGWRNSDSSLHEMTSLRPASLG